MVCEEEHAVPAVVVVTNFSGLPGSLSKGTGCRSSQSINQLSLVGVELIGQQVSGDAPEQEAEEIP